MANRSPTNHVAFTYDDDSSQVNTRTPPHAPRSGVRTIATPEIPDTKTLHIHRFVMNALEKGWSVKKRGDKFILSKKHEGKKEVFKDDYLEKIMGEML